MNTKPAQTNSRLIRVYKAKNSGREHEQSRRVSDDSEPSHMSVLATQLECIRGNMRTTDRTTACLNESCAETGLGKPHKVNRTAGYTTATRRSVIGTTFIMSDVQHIHSQADANQIVHFLLLCDYTDYRYRHARHGQNKQVFAALRFP